MRAAAGFLAFFLSISLLLSGGAFWAENLRNRNDWLSDSLMDDYRDTSQFRSYICGMLQTYLAMGAAQPIQGYWYGEWYGRYGYEYEDVIQSYATTYTMTDWDFVKERYKAQYKDMVPPNTDNPSASASDVSPENMAPYYRTQAKKLNEQMQTDKNILYKIDGPDVYTNYPLLFRNNPPSGYGFLLYFDGNTVTVTKNGQAIDVYGDGYYTEQKGQWYVPGYKNFTADEELSKVKVTIAVIDEPQLFLQGTYGKGGVSGESNYLYQLRQSLQESRKEYENSYKWIGIGAALFVLYLVFFRRDKARADKAVAYVTGKLWFEPKLLVVLLPVLPGLLAMVMRIGVDVPLLYEYGVTLVEGSDRWWYYSEYLWEVLRSPVYLLTAFWALYLLINDFRYTEKPWKNGICAMLSAAGLRQPIQRRLSRVSGLVALALLLLGAANLNLLVYRSSYGYIRLEEAWIIVLPAMILLIIAAVFLWRLKCVWTDFGTLVDQIAAVRSGNLEQPLAVDPDSDLGQAADDLNHIQQGLHSALDQQTRSERMKVELVTNVSHDLKTPLTSIISYADLLSQEELSPQAADYVRILQQKAQRLKAMVQDVFDISKAASGQLPIKPKHLDLSKLLRQTLADMAQPIEDSGLALRTAFPEGSVPVYADGDRLYRVFQNLLGNALKYALPGTRIYLTVETQNRQALVTLKNTSAAELQPGTDYTGRFVRGDESRTDGGSGLGLSIAQSFTQACNGTLSVETDGDLFTARVVLPLDSLL